MMDSDTFNKSITESNDLAFSYLIIKVTLSQKSKRKMPVHINLVKSNIKSSCSYDIACKLILLVCLLLPVVYRMFTEK